MKGISVIICCCNSSKRIGKVLQALACQVINLDWAWEIIVVDNASTDDTAMAVQQNWQALNSPVALRIVDQPVAGLFYAREKGIEESYYGYIVFCDDDNWLFNDYLQQVVNIFENNDQVSACGGMGIPVFEKAKPVWFDDYAECFATGSQEITREEGKLLNLYGAGMAIRKDSYNLLAKASFSPQFTGRKGKHLSSSEDTELTYALVLLGKELYFSDNMKFYHFMPDERMQLSYLKKLFTAFGNDGPLRNLYYANISARRVHKKLNNWNIHLLMSLVRLVKYLVIPPKAGGRSVYFHWSLAYIKSLMAIRGKYSLLRNNIINLKQFSS